MVWLLAILKNWWIKIHACPENEYEQDASKYKNQLLEYNEIVSNYYNERTRGLRKDSWTEQMVGMLGNPTRMYMKEFIKQHGLDKR